jgi:endonuclease YncB( thermonuclease family)
MKTFSILIAGTILMTFSSLGCSLSVSGLKILLSPTSCLVAIPGDTPIWRKPVTPSISNTLVSNDSYFFSLTPSIAGMPSSTLSPTLDPLSCVPQDVESEYGLVKWIVDGDTIVVDIQGRLNTVHYLGIEAPGFIPITEYRGPTATRFNEKLVRNRLVRMVKDGTDKNVAGQLLRYVLVDNIFVNYEIIRQGLAYAVATNPGMSCEATFQKAEELAALEFRGIWEPTRTPHRTYTPSMSSTAAIITTIRSMHTNTFVQPSTTSIPTAIHTTISTMTPVPAETLLITPTLTFSLTPTLTSTLTLTPTLMPTETISATISSDFLIAEYELVFSAK